MDTQVNVKTSLFFYRLRYVWPTFFYRALSGVVKRTFDFFVALFGLLIMSPFFIIIARLIKRDSPGPVFYWGPRVGKKGRIFKMVKFRTMFENPESYNGPRLTSKGDSRITPLGAWLRETKINELPQLWNVLIGEMSLVGPRPEDPHIAESWPDEERSTIAAVRPGITSPASILYRDEEKLLSQKGALNEYYTSILPEKLRLDMLYVRHHSFFSDLDTIFWTLFILVPRWAKISMEIPEAHFFAGPIARIGHRYFSWFLVDLATSLVVIGGCAVLWRTQFPLNWSVQNIILLGIVLSILFSGLNSITGLNRIDWTHATFEDAVGLILSSGGVTLLFLGFNYLESIYKLVTLPTIYGPITLRALPTNMILVIGLLSGTSFIIVRYRLRFLSMMANWWLSLRQNTLVLGERVLVVGDGEAGQIATWLLSRPLYRTAFSVVGVINDNDPTKKGMRINGYWMLGGIKDIPAIIKSRDVGVILHATPTLSRETTEYIFDLCQINNLRLIFLNELMMMIDRQITQPGRSYEYPIWLDERLEYKAMHDSNTGLPNRYLFQDRIKHSLAYAKHYKIRLAVMFIKIERIYSGTSTSEPKLDNQSLQETAKRISSCILESDTLAYVGKNKFAVILENIPDEAFPVSVANKIHELLSEPITIEKSSVQLQTKIKIEMSNDLDNNAAVETLCLAEAEIHQTER